MANKLMKWWLRISTLLLTGIIIYGLYRAYKIADYTFAYFGEAIPTKTLFLGFGGSILILLAILIPLYHYSLRKE